MTENEKVIRQKMREHGITYLKHVDDVDLLTGKIERTIYIEYEGEKWYCKMPLEHYEDVIIPEAITVSLVQLVE